MILAIGEILFDNFQNYRRVGGAPFNFSYHLKKLGFSAHFLTRVGTDPDGEELGRILENGGFDRKDLQVDPDHRSGKVNVTVVGKGIPIFDIVPDVAFDHLAFDGRVKALLQDGPELIYYGTLIQRTLKGRRFMEEVFFAAGETARFFCDVNLRPGCWSQEMVEASLARADVLKLNEEELETIITFPEVNLSRDDPCRSLMEHYSIEMVALTRGEQGSEIHSNRGSHSIGPVQDQAVADTVGAGDAYASILAIGYLGGWEPERILAAASRFSAALCGIKGALPGSDEFYGEYKDLLGEKANG